jgi:succinylglutamate desuccinylase
MYSQRKRVKHYDLHCFCTAIERTYILSCARESGQSLSAYMRRIALQGFVDKDKALPSEVLAFMGQLQHMGGQLEVISRKRLADEDLNAIERAELAALKATIEGLVEEIKNYLS